MFEAFANERQMTDLVTLSATAILRLYAAKTLSPSENWAALESHIAAWEPEIHALYAYEPEQARKEAAASTARWAKGVPKGPLDGLPVSVKELIATRGVPVPRGTAATLLVPAETDAPPAARLREDGAILFAKTTCPDYGMLSSGLSSFHPLTRNPWNLALNPGGSSAGAGAAAAAGYGPCHVGTDIGGSIRLPAAWTGTFGLKPSHGRVPIDPFYLGRVAGPMTRCVADAALMMRTLSRPDLRDATALPPADIDWTALELDPKGLRLGLMLDAGCGMPLDPEIRDAVTAAARVFEAAGAVIEEVAPVMTPEMLAGLDDFWRARSWSDMLHLDEAARAKVLPYVRAWAGRGAEVGGVEALRGYECTVEMRIHCAALFRRVDAVLSPVAPVVSFPADWASPLNDPEKPFEHIGFTVPWNMGEQPAAAINCGFARNGMPIGLQIIGPRFGDLFVLRLSKAFEDRRGAMVWPTVPS